MAFANVAIIALSASVAGCGGGGGSAPVVDTPPVASAPPPAGTPPAPPAAPAATTDVNTTVIDGAVKNAVVCFDKNANGKCDADEAQGKTDVDGKATIAVPNADVGKYPILAVVGTDAVDADHGPVTVAYTMSAPAGKPVLVSPLTTMVQQAIASTGVSVAEAEKSIKDATGITVSLFEDFTKVAAPNDGSPSAKTVARMVVVATQEQSKNLKISIGSKALDDKPITQQDLDKAIEKKLLELLPRLIEALSNPAYLAATTQQAKEAAIVAAVSGSLLSTTSLPTFVAINNQVSTPAVTSTAAAPTSGFVLATLNFTDVNNWSVRTHRSSAAQNTPDANGNTRAIVARSRSNSATVANWGLTGDPARDGELHWNGSAWVGCPFGVGLIQSERDSSGNSNYNTCDNLLTGKTNRITLDVSGKTMSVVLNQIRDGGYTNINIGGPLAQFGSTIFPQGSKLNYQTDTPLSAAVSYYPGSTLSAGQSSLVSVVGAAAAAGGIAANQAAGTACNSNPPEQNVTSFDTLIAQKRGVPCQFGATSYVYGSQTYTSPNNDIWSWSTVNIALVGNNPVNSGIAPGYFTTNVRYRFAFTGANTVTYYSCKQRFSDGGTRDCQQIGTGDYSISNLGDARVLTLGSQPSQLANLLFKTVLVERGGFVYSGAQSKLPTTYTARLNMTASNALFGVLGMPLVNPEVPFAPTAASYQGTYDVTDPNGLVGNGTVITINGNGTSTCTDKPSNTPFACSFTTTNPATGAWTFRGPNPTDPTGTTNFLTGAVVGTYKNFTIVNGTPTNTTEIRSIVGQRR